MWLIPCSSRTSSARSASAFEPLASAAAPKITRLESCPVAPNGARSIMSPTLGPEAAEPRLGGGPSPLTAGPGLVRAHLLGAAQPRPQLGQAAGQDAGRPRLHQGIAQRRSLDRAGEHGHAARVGGQLAQQGVA